MRKVKLTFPYLEWDLARQSPSNTKIWGDYQFLINEDVAECDYWVVYNHLYKDSETCICPQKNTILLTGEPFTVFQYNNKFIWQFEHIITCQREIIHPRKYFMHLGMPWYVGARYLVDGKMSFSRNYDELYSQDFVNKTKDICIISSDKNFTEGHRNRLELVNKIKAQFGNKIDVFGRGINDFEDKWDVLKDYRYCITIENTKTLDYFSEKLVDCYLSHTFPIYYGCTNINDYFNPESCIIFDLDNIDGLTKIITKVLSDKDHYNNSLPHLIEAKKKYLKEYNLFPLIVNFIDKNLKVLSKKKSITLVNEFPDKQFFLLNLIRRIFKKLKKQLSRVSIFHLKV